MMCIFATLVFVQAVNKTFFNFLQKPYLYMKNTKNIQNDNVLLALLQDEKSKNLILQEQLILNNECKKVLKSATNVFVYVATGMSVFFSKGTSKFIIATMNGEGVKLNDIAVDNSNCIIGRVVDILGDGMFKIQRIEDTKAYIPSVILNHSLYGYVNGDNDLGCDVVFETNDTLDMSKIEDDDIVITSGIGDLVTYGINIGKIKKHNGKLCVERYMDKNINIFKLIRVRSSI